MTTGHARPSVNSKLRGGSYSLVFINSSLYSIRDPEQLSSGNRAVHTIEAEMSLEPTRLSFTNTRLCAIRFARC
jgi:hypothetical protein